MVMALFEVEVVPFPYFVEDSSSTVTSRPADVVKMKLDLDTPPTVPDDPPAAGPDRALDPPPTDSSWPVELRAATVCAADAEDAARPTNSPVTEMISAAAAIKPRLIFDSGRRTAGRFACSAMVTDIVQSDDGASETDPVEVVVSEPSTTVGPAVLPSSGPEERTSWGSAGS